MKVLIAEDDEMSRLIVEAAVARAGHFYTSASDGLEAWRLFEQGDIDVVVSDRSMPRVDGLELCRRIRAHPSDQYTYFIFVTSAGDQKGLAEGNAAGADDYLIKPFDPDQLASRLAVADRITGLYRRLAEQQVQLAALNSRLFDEARTDGLTRLGNRLKLREDLDAFSKSALGNAELCCALMCDVDHFKKYNDTYGHLEGDRVLKMIAEALAAVTSRYGQGYRYGGEEFLLLLHGVRLEDGIAIAENCRAAVETLKIMNSSSPTGFVTLSVGVGLRQPGQTSISDWLKSADAALYEAKTRGRNQVHPRTSL